MNIFAPTLFGLALLFAAFGLYLLAGPRPLFARADDAPGFRPGAAEPDSDLGRSRRFVLGPSMIGAAVVCAAIAVLGSPASREQALAYGLSLAVLPWGVAAVAPSARPRRWTEWFDLLLWSAFLAAMVYSLLNPGEGSFPQPNDYVDAAAAAIGAIVLARRVIANWRDDAYIAEQFDDQGYIEHPRRLSLRGRAVLTVAGEVVLAMLVIGLLFLPKFLSE